MANSRIRGPFGSHEGFLWHTRSPLGHRDACDPEVDAIHTTDTAGPLGYHDWADPDHPAYRARHRSLLRGEARSALRGQKGSALVIRVPGRSDNERADIEVIDAQSISISSNGSLRAAPRLAADVIKRFQPLVDDICFKRAAARVDLSTVEVFAGTDDNRGRALRGGIVVPTPTKIPGTYKEALGRLAHEFGHLIQQSMYGYEQFMSRWEEEWEEHGEASYYVKGTIEYEAELLKAEILSKLPPA
jgi:hypothetical protein